MCDWSGSLVRRGVRRIGVAVWICIALHPVRARAADDVVPPTVLQQTSPEWPGAPQDHDVDLSVIVTVAADGTVVDAIADGSVGSEYAAAAVVTVKQWKFSPALRGGKPVASRVRALVHFAARTSAPSPNEPLPAAQRSAPSPTPVVLPPITAAPPATSASSVGPSPAEPAEITVHGGSKSSKASPVSDRQPPHLNTTLGWARNTS
jgi:hypothetical protein